VFAFSVLRPVSIKVMADRSRHRPFGVRGGGDAEYLEIKITSGDKILGGPGVSRITSTELQPGDDVCIMTPGGGGFGAPSTDDE
jgi:N-methylhydantoinase B